MAVHTTDAVVRAGLTSGLRQDQRLSEVDATAAPQDVDVTVVAVETADDSLLKTLHGLAADHAPGTRFLVIARQRWRIEVPVAIDHGVRAVLWHGDFSPARFTSAVLAVARGDTSFPHDLEEDPAGHPQGTRCEAHAAAERPPSQVSERERDVLRLISEGRELAEIAAELCYSERTIKYTLYGVMKRFGVRNRAHAVAHAIRTGLI
ncbi:response regulator transcription factor [Streptantibioticus parmotrematis]|uniref:helix-turn-helix transcriptional regulator n=1 Tax=Streptantibioticus parmotrematis TaxID=2873249 RepID=UPI0033F90032